MNPLKQARNGREAAYVCSLTLPLQEGNINHWFFNNIIWNEGFFSFISSEYLFRVQKDFVLYFRSSLALFSSYDDIVPWTNIADVRVHDIPLNKYLSL
jgi:hypothetical protein